MLEMLVGGGGKAFYPNSGPGPKLLQAGNKQAGYFGMLTPSELFTPSEMFYHVGIQATSPNADAGLLWAKFFYNNVTVYIPTQPMHYYPQMLSWEDLYQAGVVYGTDDNGLYPSPVNSPVPQRTVIAKTLEAKSAGFVVRLPGAGNDPNSPAVAEASMLGEIAELLTNIIAVGVGFGTGKWDKLPEGVFSKTSYHIMRTSQSGATTNALFGMGTVSKQGKVVYTGAGKAFKASNYGWWPVLEYLNPDDHILGVDSIIAGLPPPIAVDLHAAQGESTGGILNVSGVVSAATGSITASATTDLLRSQVGAITVVHTSNQPNKTSVVVEPTSTMVVNRVELLDHPPAANVVVDAFVNTLLNPVVRYAPAQLTDLKQE